MIVTFIPLAALGTLIGLVINATYEADDVKCDPLAAREILSGDQVKCSIEL